MARLRRAACGFGARQDRSFLGYLDASLNLGELAVAWRQTI